MKAKAKLIFLTLLIYGIPVSIFSTLPFFKDFYGDFESPLLNFLFKRDLSYSAVGIIFDFLLIYCVFLLFKKFSPVEKSRTYLIASAFKKISRFIFIDKLKKELVISSEEKVSALFYLVKLIFTPVMVNFLIDNTNLLVGSLSKANWLEFTQLNILKFYIPLIFYLILVADTLIFAFGYLVESPKLKNIVKSVEPTALGWLVALICYPPFNSLTGQILGWYTSDFSDFGNINTNLVMAFLSVLLFAVYLWASLALGFKASNLTNRGIVSYGPYKYVRHPAYASKVLSWWIMGVPFIKISGFLALFSLSMWTFIYFLRAVTEERHLSKDEDYANYSKEVKFMFIPGVF